MFRMYKAKVRFSSGRYSFFEAWYWKFGKHWHRTHSLSTSQEAQNDVSEFIMPQTLARSPGKSISLGFFGISNGASLRHIFLCKLLGNYMRAKLHLLFLGRWRFGLATLLQSQVKKYDKNLWGVWNKRKSLFGLWPNAWKVSQLYFVGHCMQSLASFNVKLLRFRHQNYWLINDSKIVWNRMGST